MIWDNKHGDREGGQTKEQGHAYNKSTVAKICIELEGGKKKNKKVVQLPAQEWTNRTPVVNCVSQKRNRSNNKNEWYNILVNFIF